MTALYYRLSGTTDPEERLEDACLSKAMHDTYGSRITILPPEASPPAGATVFGRSRQLGFGTSGSGQAKLDYARDPGFLWGISRSFKVCGLQEAELEVARLHAAGKDAFVKAMQEKLMTERVPRGMSLHEAIGDMVYSFIERPDCLMVQEHVAMRNERRLVFVDGTLVTHSPVAFHLTPLDRSRLAAETGRPAEELHFTDPESRTPVWNAELSRRMVRFANEVAARSRLRTMTIDVAELANGCLEVIEFNPGWPGTFGLFACDPYAIAEASNALLAADLAEEVQLQEAEALTAPAPRETAADIEADWCDEP